MPRRVRWWKGQGAGCSGQTACTSYKLHSSPHASICHANTTRMHRTHGERTCTWCGHTSRACVTAKQEIRPGAVERSFSLPAPPSLSPGYGVPSCCMTGKQTIKHLVHIMRHRPTSTPHTSWRTETVRTDAWTHTAGCAAPHCHCAGRHGRPATGPRPARHPTCTSRHPYLAVAVPAVPESGCCVAATAGAKAQPANDV